MNNDGTPTTLSEIDINVHGFTADDVIEGRKIRKHFIREGALKGNGLCIAAEWLDAEARYLGLDVTYDENLDDLDLE